jgi:hypothetical protein
MHIIILILRWRRRKKMTSEQEYKKYIEENIRQKFGYINCLDTKFDSLLDCLDPFTPEQLVKEVIERCQNSLVK